MTPTRADLRHSRDDSTAHNLPLALKLLYQVRGPDTAVSGDAMNIYGPTFSSAQVAAAVGMTHGNFRAYIARESTGWRPIGDMSAKVAGKSGEGHLFSIYDALGYALAWTLVGHGVDPQAAFRHGMLEFAHSGTSEIQPDGTMIARNPGDVFDVEKYGRTFFVLNNGAQRGHFYAQNRVTDPVSFFFGPSSGQAEAVIMVDLFRLRGRVFAGLGLDVRDYE